MEVFSEPETGIRVIRAGREGVTISGPNAGGLALVLALRRLKQTNLPMPREAEDILRGLEKVYAGHEACQKLGPSDTDTWNRPTPPEVRALRTGPPTEPGVKLGSLPVDSEGVVIRSWYNEESFPIRHGYFQEGMPGA